MRALDCKNTTSIRVTRSRDSPNDAAHSGYTWRPQIRLIVRHSCSPASRNADRAGRIAHAAAPARYLHLRAFSVQDAEFSGVGRRAMQFASSAWQACESGLPSSVMTGEVATGTPASGSGQPLSWFVRKHSA